MAKQSSRHEFKVVIEGLELKPDLVARVNQALQKVVLAELANVDLHGELAVTQLARIGNGQTNGIWARVFSPEQLERAGIQLPAEFR